MKDKYHSIWKILKDKNIKPEFFGLGFIQCKISFYERIHFYHESLQPIINIEEEVHDHRYDFVSEIIKGKLINKIYEFNPDENGSYIKTLESCNKDIHVNNDIKQVGNIKELLQIEYLSGQKYFMDNHTFHTVDAKNCVTFLTRTDYKKKFANVIRHINQEKVCPFSKQIREEECWEIIKNMLEI